MKKILVLVCAVICSLPANAYSTKNHEVLTRQAIHLLNKIYGCHYITQHEADMIIKGARSEDASFIKSLSRPFNKHFFNPQKPDELWERSNSIDVRFHRLVDRLYSRIDKHRYYYSMGEIAHHLQDATNPSHVVPVYHGPGKKDVFDKQCIHCLLPASLTTKEEVVLDRSFPLRLHTKAALLTLESIRNKFWATVTRHGKTTKKMIRWSDFWKENKCGWFGSYGKPGKECVHKKRGKDNFGATHIHKGCTHYDIAPAEYARYTRGQVKLAVNYTALFIFYAKEYAMKHHKEYHHHCH